MNHSPIVAVVCDKCNTTEMIPLVMLASEHSWTTRYVVQTLKRRGWQASDDNDDAICPDCLYEASQPPIDNIKCPACGLTTAIGVGGCVPAHPKLDGTICHGKA